MTESDFVNSQLVNRSFFFTGNDVNYCRDRCAVVYTSVFARHSIAYALSNMTDAEAPDRLSFLNTAGMFTSRLLPIDKSGDKGV